MLALAWRYRAACVRVVIQQLLLVVLGLSGLGLTGLGIDVIRRAAAPQTAAPRWPWGSEISTDWPPLLLVGGISLAILLLALVQSTLRYHTTLVVARLSQQIVVAAPLRRLRQIATPQLSVFRR